MLNHQEAFEGWIKSLHSGSCEETLKKDERGMYVWESTQHMWLAWSASYEFYKRIFT